ncbi:DinB family protein [Maribacter sp. PR1]|uniref:DinB family protein n=1 Tax=Maribacter cobaltidurans TaxID=1178778 RepID=A0ABU7IRI8_9FLAO|nr:MULTISPECIES: DinB family protein [Maribacter]MDC6388075.1 DinB family protein [Maribacter sp. PR1]MEE1975463.1 DinB family protein [Maribacter cobaltidurans]
MESQLELTLQSRKNLHKILTTTSKEDLLKIPEGFRNNIWWNIAHIVATQQILVYKFSGLQMRIPEKLVNKFMKGTVPDGTASEEDIKVVADFLISTIEWTKQDFEAGLFKDYKEYTTSAQFKLRNLEDAISFNLFHEGLHTATINTQLKRILKTP